MSEANQQRLGLVFLFFIWMGIAVFILPVVLPAGVAALISGGVGIWVGYFVVSKWFKIKDIR